MKKVAISLVVAFAIVSLVVSMALATMNSPADSIGKEVKLYFKEWAMGSTYRRDVFRQGTLIKVTLKWYLLESNDVYYWIPVGNIALIEVIK